MRMRTRNKEMATEKERMMKTRLRCMRGTRKLCSLLAGYVFHDYFDSFLLMFAFQAPRKHAHRGQDPRTQDLRAMFTKIERDVNGKDLKGHDCHVCKYVNFFSFDIISCSSFLHSGTT